jgi:hypothetical protein
MVRNNAMGDSLTLSVRFLLTVERKRVLSYLNNNSVFAVYVIQTSLTSLLILKKAYSLVQPFLEMA